MFNKIEKSFYLIMLSISIFSILFALYIEHVLSIQPCKLCLYQRIPYVFSIIICFFGIFFPNNKVFIYLLIIIFMGSIIISGYHVGIENNIFSEFSGCTNQSINTIDKSKLLRNFLTLLLIGLSPNLFIILCFNFFLYLSCIFCLIDDIIYYCSINL